jgi:RNA polymerase sigma-70 factor (ECF subfamily)
MTQAFADDRLARALLARSRRGDNEAFAQLYREQVQGVFLLALRLTGDRSKAEDVTQDTFLKALKGIGGYRGEAPVQVWLRRMAANAAIDTLRIARRWRPFDSVPDLLLVEDTAPDPSALAMDGLLARLRPQARAVVWLHTVEGWNHAELAARFGRSESWSKSILSRSLRLLREWSEASEEAIA